MAIRSLKSGTFSRSGMAGNPVIMPGSYESIASATGTGSSNTITFSSIPSTYSHLQIRMSASNTNASTAWSGLLVRFNSDSGANYAIHYIRGGGVSASAGNGTSQTSVFIDNVVSRAGNTSILASSVLDILDYSSTSKYKTVRNIGGLDLNGSGVINFNSGLWLNTSAITSISLIAEQDNWTTTSTFALYGVN